jgi:nucleoside-diphosphate-sugar epimerase
MSNILITGDAGFVGREFRRQLSDHNIVGVDIKNGMDARHFFATDTTKFDLVIQIAAIVGGRATIEGNPLSVASDLAIDSDLFQWALRTRPTNTVYYSSSAAYPISLQANGITHPLVESDIDLDDIRSPDLTYGIAKLTGEILAKYAQQDGLNVHVFRPFSGYGADQDLDYPFPSFIHRGKTLANPFQIWGDGTQTRDFIHISDIVSATLAAVKEDVQGPVNLGLGRATSFNDLAEMVASQSGYSPDVQHMPAKPTGVHYRVCDPSKMLSFSTPKITLEEGIALALSKRINHEQ